MFDGPNRYQAFFVEKIMTFVLQYIKEIYFDFGW
jgi:hypothetical protein